MPAWRFAHGETSQQNSHCRYRSRLAWHPYLLTQTLRGQLISSRKETHLAYPIISHRCRCAAAASVTIASLSDQDWSISRTHGVYHSPACAKSDPYALLILRFRTDAMDLGDGRRFSQTTPWASLRAARPRGAANQIDVSVIYVPNVQFSKIAVNVSTLDSNGSDFYQWAITDTSGNVKCSITKVNLTAAGTSDRSCSQGTVTLNGGNHTKKLCRARHAVPLRNPSIQDERGCRSGYT